jgi:fido (protein-threonine AMPylation protein)
MTEERGMLLQELKALYSEYCTKVRENPQYFFEDITIPTILISTFMNNRELYLTNSTDTHSFYYRYYALSESLLDRYSKEERQGLEALYDYMVNYNTDKLYFEEYFMLHIKLFSKTKFPEFAGTHRNHGVIVLDLPGFGVDWPRVTTEMSKLRPFFNEIIELGNQENFDIFEYIDMVVKLNVKMIYIQPFTDGNKRVSRALTNLLLKRVGIPPAYIELDDKNTYLHCLRKAALEGDYDYINRLYYHRIAASLMERGLAFGPRPQVPKYDEEGVLIYEHPPSKPK